MRAPQLMTLVYIAHGWYLGLTGTPLLNEPPQAWEIGPVIPTLYNSLKIYGNDPVREKISKPDAPTSADYASPAEDEVRKFLNGVWQAYGSFSDAELLKLTTNPDAPWDRTWREHGPIYTNGVDIPEQYIKDHYQTLNVSVVPHGVPAAVPTA